MSEDSSKKTLSAPKKLQLTRTVEGRVQQTFSRGRSKTVMVEVKRTRTFNRNDKGNLVESGVQEEGGLTEEERKSRLNALKTAAKLREEEEKAASEIPTEEKIEEAQGEEVREAPQEEQSKDKATLLKEEFGIAPVAGLKIIEDAPDDWKPEPGTVRDKPKKKVKTADEPDRNTARPSRNMRDDKRSRGKLTIANFDREERMRSLASIKRARQKAKRQNDGGVSAGGEKMVREIVIPEVITVQELANRMAERSADVVRELMKLGMIIAPGQEIDQDTAELMVTEFGHKPKRVADSDIEDVLKEEEVAEGALKHRAPIVTVMGHVDHGKTSLLDALRKTSVTDGEAGGITQHIGAYQVRTDGGDSITFLDTPGHAAFTAMRARGAKVTDIVVLVVAADDGIMPQTQEAISHAKAAEVPIIVAINKIDKPDADPRRVRNELLSYELVPEDMGGDVMVVEVSALQRLNLDGLLEAISLQAEVMELTASPDARPRGSVVEAQVDVGKGAIATLLVQQGTLRTGDIVVAGTSYGRVKALIDEHGRKTAEAGPSVPVEVLGFNSPPEAGEAFAIVQEERQARDITEYRVKHKKAKESAAHVKAQQEGSEEDVMARLFQTASDGNKELRLVLKGDVQGSVEAIEASVLKLSNDEVKVKIVHRGVGGITESDTTLAAATGAIVLGFNVRANVQAREAAENDDVRMSYFSVIYDLIDDVKALVGGMMEPIIHEQYLGTAEIQQVFSISKRGKVAGCLVRDGIIKRGSGVRLIRDDVVIHEGKLKTLKRFKDDMAEVKDGFECGMAFEKYDDIREGDKIEAFEMIEKARVLE